jgi:hypothetical protein
MISFTPRTLHPLGKRPSVPTEQEDVWALDLVRTLSINEKSLVLMGI